MGAPTLLSERRIPRMSTLLVLAVLSSFVAVLVYAWVTMLYPILAPETQRRLVRFGTLFAGMYGVVACILLVCGLTAVVNRLMG